jgi:hypothetical protein
MARDEKGVKKIPASASAEFVFGKRTRGYWLDKEIC